MTARRGAREDDGFTIAEVVVAMVLIAGIVTSGLALLTRTTSVARQNLKRSAASNLLTRQLEAAQGVKPAAIPDGVLTTTTAVGGTTYTVTQNVGYVASPQSVSQCPGTTVDVLFKHVQVTVTWPVMEAVAPVRGDTLRTMGLGSDPSGLGHGVLVVSVLRADGSPVAGATVTLDPGGASRVTGAAGCVVFPDLPAGTYSAQASVPASGSDPSQSGWSGGLAVEGGKIESGSVTVYPPPPPPTPDPVPSDTAGSGSTDPGATTTDPGASSGTDPSGGTTTGGGGGGTAPAPAPPPPPPPPPPPVAS